MDFLIQVSVSCLLCIIAVSLAILLPRWVFSRKLRKQLLETGGHKFTPDIKTWRDYMATTSPLRPLFALVIYGILLILLLAYEASNTALVIAVTLGFYLLLRQLLYMLPPSYGVTAQGVTVLSWLPAFPLGLYGTSSVFIPWQAVEICAIDQQFIVVLTPKMEARLVFSPENEEQVCSFIDSLLRHRGYRIN